MSDDIRTRSRDLLASSLQSGLSSIPPESLGSSQPSDTQLSNLAEQLEAAIYAGSGSDTSNAYRDEIRQRSLALKKDNPTALIPALLQGTMSPQQFAQASHAELQSPQQALEDAQLRQENIQQSIGLSSNTADGDIVEATHPVSDSQIDAASGQVGVAEDMLGGEGEFKARGQPKTGKAMEGIEFETPQ